jgi:glutathionylspermidine synthase
MRRRAMSPRPDWARRCEEVGFAFHSDDGVYWDESAAYEFDAAQVDHLEAVTEELHQLALQAVDWIVEGERFHPFGLGPAAIEEIVRSWRRRDPSLFGRFDLSWDGIGEPKLLEYNADTPTSLLESSVVQWFWLQDTLPAADQFNSLHEKLIARWRELRADWPLDMVVHFAALRGSREDQGNTAYLLDTAVQAGLEAVAICVEDIGFDPARATFVDLDGRPITHCFKLYPWEWMFQDEFAARLAGCRAQFLEPPWKLLLSSKVILVALAELFPGHPNLLPASLKPDVPVPFVRKPRVSREGSNVRLVTAADSVETDGPYADEAHIYQAAAPLPQFGPHHAVVGSWVVGDRAAGLCIREDESRITRNTSRFLPHYFI